MPDLWAGLGVGVQDLLVLAALISPAIVLGAVVLRGYAPWPLIAALLRRFAAVNLLFAGLIAAATGLGIGILAQERALREGSARAADGFDLIVAAPGSDVTAMLATVYLQPTALPLLDGTAYAAVAAAPRVTMAAPVAFGDNVDGAPVVGTIAAFVTHLSRGAIEGRAFAAEGEAVIGSRVPLRIGDTFLPQHGLHEADRAIGDGHALDDGGDDDGNAVGAEAHADDGDDAAEDEHAGGHTDGSTGQSDTHGGPPLVVTGRMAATGTPWDGAILVPIETVWEVHGLPNGHADPAAPIGPPFDPALFPGTPAIVVGADALFANYALRSEFDASPDMMAFFPASVLTRLYGLMGDVRAALTLMATVAQVLVAAAIVTALLIVTRLFARQLAMLRALGAPRRFVFAVVWGYVAVLVGSGVVLGAALGIGSAGALSAAVSIRTGVAVSAAPGWPEAHLLAATVSAAMILALLPAAAALRAPVTAALRG